MKDKITVSQLLTDSEKGEIIDWLRDNIVDAEKCMVICAVPDGEGGLNLRGRQMGFKYSYELAGFAEWVSGLDWSDDGEEE